MAAIRKAIIGAPKHHISPLVAVLHTRSGRSVPLCYFCNYSQPQIHVKFWFFLANPGFSFPLEKWCTMTRNTHSQFRVVIVLVYSRSVQKQQRRVHKISLSLSPLERAGEREGENKRETIINVWLAFVILVLIIRIKNSVRSRRKKRIWCCTFEAHENLMKKCPSAPIEFQFVHNSEKQRNWVELSACG